MNITLYGKIFAATGGPYMQLYVSFKREAVKILQTGERHHEDRVERDFKIQTFLED